MSFHPTKSNTCRQSTKKSTKQLAPFAERCIFNSSPAWFALRSPRASACGVFSTALARGADGEKSRLFHRWLQSVSLFEVQSSQMAGSERADQKIGCKQDRIYKRYSLFFSIRAMASRLLQTAQGICCGSRSHWRESGARSFKIESIPMLSTRTALLSGLSSHHPALLDSWHQPKALARSQKTRPRAHT